MAPSNGSNGVCADGNVLATMSNVLCSPLVIALTFVTNTPFVPLIMSMACFTVSSRAPLGNLKTLKKQNLGVTFFSRFIL